MKRMINAINIENLNEVLVAGILVTLYALFSISYFVFFDSLFYAKGALNNGITFAVPVLYMFLVGSFICLYSFLLKQEVKVVALPISLMAIVLPLFYLLTDLKIGMLKANPFGGNRGIFGVYTILYYILAMSIFSVLSGFTLRMVLANKMANILKLKDAVIQNLIFYSPIFVYFLFILALLFKNGLAIYGYYFIILFFISLSFDSSDPLNKIKVLLSKFLENKRLFLITLFIVSVLIRYIWGLRILGITGDNFPKASDDGLAYDPFAAMLAQGRAIDPEAAFYISGFGYWHFLAAIYKLFGLHNFKAVIIIQSLVSSFVPIFTYIIGEKIFKNRFVAVAASLMTAFDQTLIFLSIVICMEAIYIPLVILAFMLIGFMLIKGVNYKKAFVIGSVFGLANNVRSEVLLFPLVLAFLICIFMWKKLRLKDAAIIVASLLVGFTLFMFIQHITNYATYGQLRVTPDSLGQTFQGDYGTLENVALNKMGFNPFWYPARSLSIFIHNPAQVSGLILKGFVKRIIIYFFKPNFGVFDPVYLVNPASGFFFRYAPQIQFYEFVFMLAGIVLVFFKKENMLAKVILITFTIYLSSLYGFIWVTNSRHRGVLVPILMLFFAYGLNFFYQKLKKIYSLEPEPADEIA